MGCLGWKPSDFKKYSLLELRMSVDGFRDMRAESWEMVRHSVFWPVKLQSQKKFSIRDIKLPFDNINDEELIPITTRRLSTKDEVIDYYKKRGLEIDDFRANKIIEDDRNRCQSRQQNTR